MEEIRPSFGAVAKELQDFIYNEIDVITESDWFAERLDIKVAIAAMALKKGGAHSSQLKVDPATPRAAVLRVSSIYLSPIEICDIYQPLGSTYININLFLLTISFYLFTQIIYINIFWFCIHKIYVFIT